MNDFKAVKVKIGKHSLFLMSFLSYVQWLKQKYTLASCGPTMQRGDA